MKNKYLSAMKADVIPEGSSGLWFIHKLIIDKDGLSNRFGKAVSIKRGTYTYLRCITEKTLYDEQPGAVVMEDTPFELQTHLGFAMRAYGNVLVTGLGLGCVIRGLLANPKVNHITCIENSPDVLKLVAPYMPTARLTIIEADALSWAFRNQTPFDCAWHDLWTNYDKAEPHLDIWHARLLRYCKDYTKHQGAWALSRSMKSLLIRNGFSWMG